MPIPHSRLRRALRGLLRGTAAVVLLLAALMGLGLWTGIVWRSPPYFTAYAPQRFAEPPMSTAEYERVIATHPRPYVVEVRAGAERADGVRQAGGAQDAGGAVLVFGTTHTKDPDAPELRELRRRWARFRPTVALVEGRLDFLVQGLMDPVRTLGEMGLTASLAKADGIPLYSWEPPRETEVRLMRRRFPKERLALFYVLRPYASNARHGRPADPVAYVDEVRATRTRWAGLEGTLPSMAALDSMWRRDFAGEKDWRELDDRWGWPGYLADIAAESNAVRDEHLANVAVHLARRGERVFVGTGLSHSVKVERTLRAALR